MSSNTSAVWSLPCRTGGGRQWGEVETGKQQRYVPLIAPGVDDSEASGGRDQPKDWEALAVWPARDEFRRIAEQLRRAPSTISLGIPPQTYKCPQSTYSGH